MTRKKTLFAVALLIIVVSTFYYCGYYKSRSKAELLTFLNSHEKGKGDQLVYAKAENKCLVDYAYGRMNNEGINAIFNHYVDSDSVVDAINEGSWFQSKYWVKALEHCTEWAIVEHSPAIEGKYTLEVAYDLLWKITRDNNFGDYGLYKSYVDMLNSTGANRNSQMNFVEGPLSSNEPVLSVGIIKNEQKSIVIQSRSHDDKRCYFIDMRYELTEDIYGRAGEDINHDGITNELDLMRVPKDEQYGLADVSGSETCPLEPDIRDGAEWSSDINTGWDTNSGRKTNQKINAD